MIRKRRNVTHLPGSIATAIRDCLHNNPFSLTFTVINKKLVYSGVVLMNIVVTNAVTCIAHAQKLV